MLFQKADNNRREDLDVFTILGVYTEPVGIDPVLCAEHVRQLGSESHLHNLAENSSI